MVKAEVKYIEAKELYYSIKPLKRQTETVCGASIEAI